MTLKKDKPVKSFRPKTDKPEKKEFRPKTDRTEKKTFKPKSDKPERTEKFEKGDKPLEAPKPKVNTTVYVSNLSYRRDQVGIKKLFTRYGSIKKIKIVIDLETEQSKGMAFVEMATVAQAKAAIEGLNGEIIDGRTLKASWAIPQDKPFYKKFDDYKDTDRKPIDKKSFDRDEKKPFKKFDDRKPADKKSFDRDEKKPFKKFADRKATDKKSFDRDDKKPFKKFEKKAPRKLKG